MKPFSEWTDADVQAHNARVGRKEVTPINSQDNEIARIRRPESSEQVGAIDFSSRPDTDEQKLNKTERAYLWHLRKLNVPSLRIQKITLKLADDCRLTVDFTYVNCNGRKVFVDVKGFQREDALIKMKVAARLYTEFDFQIVTRDKGQWVETMVKP